MVALCVFTQLLEEELVSRDALNRLNEEGGKLHARIHEFLLHREERRKSTKIFQYEKCIKNKRREKKLREKCIHRGIGRVLGKRLFYTPAWRWSDGNRYSTPYII